MRRPEAEVNDRVKPRILVIDDDAQTLTVTAALLRRTGHTVETATEWSQVTELLFRGSGVDLILVDVMMPAVRGDQLVPILRRYTAPGTAIVLYSAMPEEKLAGLARTSAATAYLQKGRFAGLDLVSALAKILEARATVSPPGP